jgi:3-dehydroquinate synthase
LLKSLPKEEWVNGFAEIIKHACIKDAAMFKLLEQHKLRDFQKDSVLLNKLIQRNALLKSKVVQQDEFEQGDRKLLNFGHTLGHAIENTYKLPHGHAVSIGMVIAAYISRDMLQLKDADRIAFLIVKYGLTAFFKFNADRALELMKSDKKATRKEIQYILLEKIGKGIVKPLTLEQIAPVVQQLATQIKYYHAGNDTAIIHFRNSCCTRFKKFNAACMCSSIDKKRRKHYPQSRYF